MFQDEPSSGQQSERGNENCEEKQELTAGTVKTRLRKTFTSLLSKGEDHLGSSVMIPQNCTPHPPSVKVAEVC